MSWQPEKVNVPGSSVDKLDYEDESGSEVEVLVSEPGSEEDEIDLTAMPIYVEAVDGDRVPLVTFMLGSSPLPNPTSAAARSRSRSRSQLPVLSRLSMPRPAEDFSHSRSLLPGPSHLSTPWTVEDFRQSPRLVFRGRGEEEEEEEEVDAEVEEEEEELAPAEVLCVEMGVEEPTPRMNKRVARAHPSRGGAYTRGSHTQGTKRGRGCCAATCAVSGGSEWRRGEPIIETCISNVNIPPRLQAVVDEAARSMEGRAKQNSGRGVRDSRENDDEMDDFYDVEGEEQLFGGDKSALHLDWSPMGTFRGSQESFLSKTSGPVRNFANMYEGFRTFWDDDILGLIVVETNRYAAEIFPQSARFANSWVDTNIDEILILFSFWMMLGIHRMPSVKSCFATNILLKTEIFKKLLTEERYWNLNRALHFVDNSTRTSQSSKLFCLGPVLDHLNSKFKESFTPYQDILIDESLMLWKGNLSLRQYIRTKAAKFGIKTFELCDVTTGYMWSFLAYTGKAKATSTTSSFTFPKTTKTVIDLITPLLHTGYRLFMDSWFNSPILARYLKRNKTDCVGTLRKTRGVPPLLQHATLPEGHYITRHAGDVVVMAYQDRKTVYTISTYHGNELVQTDPKPRRSSQYKPSVIVDYNRGMGSVDKKDQTLEPYLIERKRCKKWYKEFFKRLLNVSVFNSRILVDHSSGRQVSSLTARLSLVSEIMKRHLSQVPKPRQRQVSYSIPVISEARLIGKHFIVRTEVGEKRTAGRSLNSVGRQICVWCTTREERRRRTVYMCDKCEVPLCLDECFKKYHTVP